MFSIELLLLVKLFTLNNGRNLIERTRQDYEQIGQKLNYTGLLAIFANMKARNYFLN